MKIHDEQEENDDNEKLIRKNEYQIDTDFKIPKEHLNNFQSIFSFIKKKMQVKYSRKAHIDSLLKKCKGKFFKAVHKTINLCLKDKIKRLPQRFITNITIQYNRKFLYQSLIGIYDAFGILPAPSDLQSLIIERRKLLFKVLINKNLSQAYKEYIESRQFKKDLNEVSMSDGKRNAILYKYVAVNFVRYYEFSKPHIVKNKIKKIVNNEVKNNNNLNLENTSIKEIPLNIDLWKRNLNEKKDVKSINDCNNNIINNSDNANI